MCYATSREDVGRSGEESFTPSWCPLPMASPSPLTLCCLHNKVQSPQPDLKAFCHLALSTSPVSPPLSTNHMILLILLGYSPSFPPPDVASCCLLILWYPFSNVLPLRSPLSSKGQVQDHLPGRFLSPSSSQPISGPSCGLVGCTLLWLGSMSIQSWEKPPSAYFIPARAQHNTFFFF